MEAENEALKKLTELRFTKKRNAKTRSINTLTDEITNTQAKLDGVKAKLAELSEDDNSSTNRTLQQQQTDLVELARYFKADRGDVTDKDVQDMRDKLEHHAESVKNYVLRIHQEVLDKER